MLQLLVNQWCKRCVAGQSKIRLLRRELSLPLVALEWGGIAIRLDGLHVAIANSAHAQHQSMLVQSVLVRVELN
jgi:hypothetical protein